MFWFASPATRRNKFAGGAVKSEIIMDQYLAEELHKPVLKNLKNESTLIFYGQYLGCWSCWCTIKLNKGICIL